MDVSIKQKRSVYVSVNIYLVTEDLKQKEMNCAMYHKGQSEPYEVNIKGIKDENKHEDNFEELFNNLKNICYYTILQNYPRVYFHL